jgi:hypothetical protein
MNRERVMAAQQYRNVIERRELAGVVVFLIVGVVLVALAPAKQPAERASAAVVEACTSARRRSRHLILRWPTGRRESPVTTGPQAEPETS